MIHRSDRFSVVHCTVGHFSSAKYYSADRLTPLVGRPSCCGYATAAIAALVVSCCHPRGNPRRLVCCCMSTCCLVYRLSPVSGLPSPAGPRDLFRSPTSCWGSPCIGNSSHSWDCRGCSRSASWHYPISPSWPAPELLAPLWCLYLLFDCRCMLCSFLALAFMAANLALWACITLSWRCCPEYGLFSPITQTFVPTFVLLTWDGHFTPIPFGCW